MIEKLIKLAYDNPASRAELLPVIREKLSSYEPVSNIPKATRRAPGKKFREGLKNWIARDAQINLEVKGVPQNAINILLGTFSDILTDKDYDGDYSYFETQQEAIDWLKGKYATPKTLPADALGYKRYPDIVQAYIQKYGLGVRSTRNSVKAQWNKLKKHQKAIAACLIKNVGIYKAPKAVKEVEKELDSLSEDRAQKLLPFFEWATKIPMWPPYI